jgi:hypothetical protein
MGSVQSPSSKPIITPFERASSTQNGNSGHYGKAFRGITDAALALLHVEATDEWGAVSRLESIRGLDSPETW